MKFGQEKIPNNLAENLAKFIFIFVILIVAVFSVKYTGILEPNGPFQTTGNSEYTETPPAGNSSTDTNTDSSQSTDHTASGSQDETTYPTATLPDPPETTSPEIPPIIDTGITLADITDEKMAALITKKYLTIHPNSRPGIKLTAVKNIVVHYVANPGTSALNNWRYFENANNVSAHFIIGLDGEILQCMPLDEVAWAVGTTEGNYTSISIECCHPDASGKFTDATYKSLIKLVSWLCNRFDLEKSDVLRHYDYVRYNSSGMPWQKLCPKYFVDYPSEWEKFKNSLILK